MNTLSLKCFLDILAFGVRRQTQKPGAHGTVQATSEYGRVITRMKVIT